MNLDTRPFQHTLLLRLLKYIERQYQVAILQRHQVRGAEGMVYCKATGARFFQMSFEASFATRDLLVRQEAVLEEMAVEASNDYLDGLKQAGGKAGDILLMLAYPANPPVVVTEPTEDGTVNVFTKLIVSLPTRLPNGLPENFQFKE